MRYEKEKKKKKRRKGKSYPANPSSHSAGNLKLFCCKWLAEAEHQIMGMYRQFCTERSVRVPSALMPEELLHCIVTGNLLIAQLVNVYYVMYF